MSGREKRGSSRRSDRERRLRSGDAAEGSARRHLLAIQMKLWRRLQRDIDASITDDPSNISIYQEEYERDLRRYESISSKAELVETALLADVVYVGDYHSLPQAQRTLVKLLLALCRRRQVTLAIELVHAVHQKHLDRYLAGELPEARFLQRIEYEKTWGFAWPPYRDILEVARDQGCRVLGINSDPVENEKDHLVQRDLDAAKLIVDEMEARPDRLVVVFDGDLHVARDHLPLLVDSELRRRKARPRQRVIVHQNAEAIYWRLAREGREQRVSVVRLAEDAFCVLNASPIEKLHSYLNWVAARDTLEPPTQYSSWELSPYEGAGALEVEDDPLDDEEADGALDRGAEYAEQVLHIVQAQARFLGVARDDLDSFELYTVNDLDFLEHLVETGRFTQDELDDVKRQILSNESYFIPKGDIIYLADFSVVNAAEEAAHFLHHKCSGYRWDRTRDLAGDFYFRSVTEALGFFGSKVIIPTRECWTERDCMRFVEHELKRARSRKREQTKRRPKAAVGKAARAKRSKKAPAQSGPESRLTIAGPHASTLLASRVVLLHRTLEREYLETGDWHAAGRALTQPADVHLLVTHMLGHMLGDKLYTALVQGIVTKKKIRELFHAPLEGRGVALGRYLELVRLTATIDHGQSRGELL